MATRCDSFQNDIPVPGGLFEGRLIKIDGVVGPQGKRVNIYLKAGAEDGDEVVLSLHFNFYHQHMIVNCWRGQWGTEERLSHNSYKGTAFQTTIKCLKKGFEITVNCQKLYQLPYQGAPLAKVRYLEITGDLALKDTLFTGSPMKIDLKCCTKEDRPPTTSKEMTQADNTNLGNSPYPGTNPDQPSSVVGLAQMESLTVIDIKKPEDQPFTVDSFAQMEPVKATGIEKLEQLLTVESLAQMESLKATVIKKPEDQPLMVESSAQIESVKATVIKKPDQPFIVESLAQMESVKATGIDKPEQPLTVEGSAQKNPAGAPSPQRPVELAARRSTLTILSSMSIRHIEQETKTIDLDLESVKIQQERSVEVIELQKFVPKVPEKLPQPPEVIPKVPEEVAGAPKVIPKVLEEVPEPPEVVPIPIEVPEEASKESQKIMRSEELEGIALPQKMAMPLVLKPKETKSNAPSPARDTSFPCIIELREQQSVSSSGISEHPPSEKPENSSKKPGNVSKEPETPEKSKPPEKSETPERKKTEDKNKKEAPKPKLHSFYSEESLTSKRIYVENNKIITEPVRPKIVFKENPNMSASAERIIRTVFASVIIVLICLCLCVVALPFPLLIQKIKGN